MKLTFTSKLIVALLMLSSTLALAAQGNGSECGLIKAYDQDSYVDASDLKTVTHETTYTKLEMEQIVITAKHFRSDAVVPNTLKAAIDSLSSDSEAGDVYINDQIANGQTLTTVTYYPGGNPVGLLFIKGTTHAVGEIQDSSVVCIQ